MQPSTQKGSQKSISHYLKLQRSLEFRTDDFLRICNLPASLRSTTISELQQLLATRSFDSLHCNSLDEIHLSLAVNLLVIKLATKSTLNAQMSNLIISGLQECGELIASFTNSNQISCTQLHTKFILVFYVLSELSYAIPAQRWERVDRIQRNPLIQDTLTFITQQPMNHSQHLMQFASMKFYVSSILSAVGLIQFELNQLTLALDNITASCRLREALLKDRHAFLAYAHPVGSTVAATAIVTNSKTHLEEKQIDFTLIIIYLRLKKARAFIKLAKYSEAASIVEKIKERINAIKLNHSLSDNHLVQLAHLSKKAEQIHVESIKLTRTLLIQDRSLLLSEIMQPLHHQFQNSNELSQQNKHQSIHRLQSNSKSPAHSNNNTNKMNSNEFNLNILSNQSDLLEMNMSEEQRGEYVQKLENDIDRLSRCCAKKKSNFESYLKGGTSRSNNRLEYEGSQSERASLEQMINKSSNSHLLNVNTTVHVQRKVQQNPIMSRDAANSILKKRKKFQTPKISLQQFQPISLENLIVNQQQSQEYQQQQLTTFQQLHSSTSQQYLQPSQSEFILNNQTDAYQYERGSQNHQQDVLLNQISQLQDLNSNQQRSYSNSERETGTGVGLANVAIASTAATATTGQIGTGIISTQSVISSSSTSLHSNLWKKISNFSAKNSSVNANLQKDKEYNLIQQQERINDNSAKQLRNSAFSSNNTIQPLSAPIIAQIKIPTNFNQLPEQATFDNDENRTNKNYFSNQYENQVENIQDISFSPRRRKSFQNEKQCQQLIVENASQSQSPSNFQELISQQSANVHASIERRWFKQSNIRSNSNSGMIGIKTRQLPRSVQSSDHIIESPILLENPHRLISKNQFNNNNINNLTHSSLSLAQTNRFMGGVTGAVGGFTAQCFSQDQTKASCDNNEETPFHNSASQTNPILFQSRRAIDIDSKFASKQPNSSSNLNNQLQLEQYVSQQCQHPQQQQQQIHLKGTPRSITINRLQLSSVENSVEKTKTTNRGSRTPVSMVSSLSPDFFLPAQSQLSSRFSQAAISPRDSVSRDVSTTTMIMTSSQAGGVPYVNLLNVRPDSSAPNSHRRIMTRTQQRNKSARIENNSKSPHKTSLDYLQQSSSSSSQAYFQLLSPRNINQNSQNNNNNNNNNSNSSRSNQMIKQPNYTNNKSTNNNNNNRISSANLYANLKIIANTFQPDQFVQSPSSPSLQVPFQPFSGGAVQLNMKNNAPNQGTQLNGDAAHMISSRNHSKNSICSTPAIQRALSEMNAETLYTGISQSALTRVQSSDSRISPRKLTFNLKELLSKQEVNRNNKQKLSKEKGDSSGNDQKLSQQQLQQSLEEARVNSNRSIGTVGSLINSMKDLKSPRNNNINSKGIKTLRSSGSQNFTGGDVLSPTAAVTAAREQKSETSSPSLTASIRSRNPSLSQQNYEEIIEMSPSRSQIPAAAAAGLNTSGIGNINKNAGIDIPAFQNTHSIFSSKRRQSLFADFNEKKQAVGQKSVGISPELSIHSEVRQSQHNISDSGGTQLITLQKKQQILKQQSIILAEVEEGTNTNRISNSESNLDDHSQFASISNLHQSTFTNIPSSSGLLANSHSAGKKQQQHHAAISRRKVFLQKIPKSIDAHFTSNRGVSSNAATAATGMSTINNLKRMSQNNNISHSQYFQQQQQAPPSTPSSRASHLAKRRESSVIFNGRTSPPQLVKQKSFSVLHPLSVHNAIVLTNTSTESIHQVNHGNNKEIVSSSNANNESNRKHKKFKRSLKKKQSIGFVSFMEDQARKMEIRDRVFNLISGFLRGIHVDSQLFLSYPPIQFNMVMNGSIIRVRLSIHREQHLLKSLDDEIQFNISSFQKKQRKGSASSAAIAPGTGGGIIKNNVRDSFLTSGSVGTSVVIGENHLLLGLNLDSHNNSLLFGDEVQQNSSMFHARTTGLSSIVTLHIQFGDMRRLQIPINLKKGLEIYRNLSNNDSAVGIHTAVGHSEQKLTTVWPLVNLEMARYLNENHLLNESDVGAGVGVISGLDSLANSTTNAGEQANLPSISSTEISKDFLGCMRSVYVIMSEEEVKAAAAAGRRSGLSNEMSMVMKSSSGLGTFESSKVNRRLRYIYHDEILSIGGLSTKIDVFLRFSFARTRKEIGIAVEQDLSGESFLRAQLRSVLQSHSKLMNQFSYSVEMMMILSNTSVIELLLQEIQTQWKKQSSLNKSNNLGILLAHASSLRISELNPVSESIVELDSKNQQHKSKKQSIHEFLSPYSAVLSAAVSWSEMELQEERGGGDELENNGLNSENNLLESNYKSEINHGKLEVEYIHRLVESEEIITRLLENLSKAPTLVFAFFFKYHGERFSVLVKMSMNLQRDHNYIENFSDLVRDSSFLVTARPLSRNLVARSLLQPIEIPFESIGGVCSNSASELLLCGGLKRKTILQLISVFASRLILSGIDISDNGMRLCKAKLKFSDEPAQKFSESLSPQNMQTPLAKILFGRESAANNPLLGGFDESQIGDDSDNLNKLGRNSFTQLCQPLFEEAHANQMRTQRIGSSALSLSSLEPQKPWATSNPRLPWLVNDILPANIAAQSIVVLPKPVDFTFKSSENNIRCSSWPIRLSNVNKRVRAHVMFSLHACDESRFEVISVVLSDASNSFKVKLASIMPGKVQTILRRFFQPVGNDVDNKGERNERIAHQVIDSHPKQSFFSASRIIESLLAFDMRNFNGMKAALRKPKEPPVNNLIISSSVSILNHLRSAKPQQLEKYYQKTETQFCKRIGSIGVCACVLDSYLVSREAYNSDCTQLFSLRVSPLHSRSKSMKISFSLLDLRSIDVTRILSAIPFVHLEKKQEQTALIKFLVARIRLIRGIQGSYLVFDTPKQTNAIHFAKQVRPINKLLVTSMHNSIRSSTTAVAVAAATTTNPNNNNSNNMNNQPHVYDKEAQINKISSIIRRSDSMTKKSTQKRIQFRLLEEGEESAGITAAEEIVEKETIKEDYQLSTPIQRLLKQQSSIESNNSNRSPTLKKRTQAFVNTPPQQPQLSGSPLRKPLRSGIRRSTTHFIGSGSSERISSISSRNKVVIEEQECEEAASKKEERQQEMFTKLKGILNRFQHSERVKGEMLRSNASSSSAQQQQSSNNNSNEEDPNNNDFLWELRVLRSARSMLFMGRKGEGFLETYLQKSRVVGSFTRKLLNNTEYAVFTVKRDFMLENWFVEIYIPKTQRRLLCTVDKADFDAVKFHAIKKALPDKLRFFFNHSANLIRFNDFLAFVTRINANFGRTNGTTAATTSANSQSQQQSYSQLEQSTLKVSMQSGQILQLQGMKPLAMVGSDLRVKFRPQPLKITINNREIKGISPRISEFQLDERSKDGEQEEGKSNMEPLENGVVSRQLNFMRGNRKSITYLGSSNERAIAGGDSAINLQSVLPSSSASASPRKYLSPEVQLSSLSPMKSSIRFGGSLTAVNAGSITIGQSQSMTQISPLNSKPRSLKELINKNRSALLGNRSLKLLAGFMQTRSSERAAILKWILEMTSEMDDAFVSRHQSHRVRELVRFSEIHLWCELLRQSEFRAEEKELQVNLHFCALRLPVFEMFFHDYISTDSSKEGVISVTIDMHHSIFAHKSSATSTSWHSSMTSTSVAANFGSAAMNNQNNHSNTLKSNSTRSTLLAYFFTPFNNIPYTTTSNYSLMVSHLQIDKAQVRTFSVNMRELLNLFIAEGFYRFQTNYMSSKLSYSDLKHIAGFLVLKIKNSNQLELMVSEERSLFISNRRIKVKGNNPMLVGSAGKSPHAIAAAAAAAAAAGQLGSDAKKLQRVSFSEGSLHNRGMHCFERIVHVALRLILKISYYFRGSTIEINLAQCGTTAYVRKQKTVKFFRSRIPFIKELLESNGQTMQALERIFHYIKDKMLFAFIVQHNLQFAQE